MKMRDRARFASVVLALGVLLAACSGSEETPEAAPAAPVVEEAESEAEEAPAEEAPTPVTLTAVTSFPLAAVEHAGFRLFLEKLAVNAPWIEIDYRGAGDVMSPFVMGEAVSSGAIDMASLPPAYYAEQFPLATALHLPRLEPADQRSVGLHDWLADKYRSEFGIEYLGYVTGGVPFQLYVNEPLTTADLSGLNVRVVQTYAAMVEELGGTPITLPGSEIYTAMERGVVDGFGWASVGVTFNGWQEVTKYEIEPGFYQVLLSVIMNQNVFDGLEPVTQQALIDTMIETELEIVGLYAELATAEQAERQADGMTVIRLNNAEAERLVETAYEQGWADAERLSPAVTEFREIYESLTQ